MSEPSIQDLKTGDGPSMSPGNNVSVHYTLTLNGFQEAGGKVVDSSRDRGQPFTFRHGMGEVIQGWDMGVKTMKVGGHRRLIIPSQLGYGASGAGAAVPPNSTLYFDIELLDIKS